MPVSPPTWLIDEAIHRKCSQNFSGHVGVVGIVIASSMAISSMFWQKRAIQAVPSACSRYPPVGSGALRSKTPMLSNPRKPPSKTFRPRAVLAVDPPGEVQQQLLKTTLEPVRVAFARFSLVQAVGEDGGPGMNRRVDVAEIPLVGRNLAVGVHVALAQHQLQLLLAEIRVHQRQREDVESEVPGRVPGILPLVRHGNHIAVVHVVPVVVAGSGLARSP